MFSWQIIKSAFFPNHNYPCVSFSLTLYLYLPYGLKCTQSLETRIPL